MHLTQAYGTWAPSDDLCLDLGMFGTVRGAEVTETWPHMNHTRGTLYDAMQPFWHAWLRASDQFDDSLGLTALVFNGIPNGFEADALDGALVGWSTAERRAASRRLHGAPEVYPGRLGAFGDDVEIELGTLVDPFVGLVISAGIGDLSLWLNPHLNFRPRWERAADTAV